MAEVLKPLLLDETGQAMNEKLSGHTTQMSADLQNLADIKKNMEIAQLMNIVQAIKDNTISQARLSSLESGLSNERVRAITRENEIEELFTLPTQEAVNKWLDEHPEATTTVQDHSLTIDKMVIGTLGYVTPEMFGAVGDGVTDDTEALQECFDSGKNIAFSRKIYLISKTLELNSNVIIEGNIAKLICGNTFTGNFIYVKSKYAKIRCLELSGDRTLEVSGITCELDNECIIENCIIHDMGYHGIGHCKHTLHNYLYNCTCLTGNDNGQGAIFTGVNGVRIIGNIIKSKYGDALDHAIYCGGSSHDDIKIIGNTLIAEDGCTAGPLIACYPSSTDYTTHTNVEIASNFVDYGTGTIGRAGIALEIDGSFHDNICIGRGSDTPACWFLVCNSCEIHGNHFINGIVKMDIVKKSLITSNRINAGIKFTSKSENCAENIIINGNHFSECQTGIEIIDGDMSNSKVIDNVFDKCTNGIIIQNGSDSNIINNNVFKDTKQFAIRIIGGTNLIVSNNIIDSTNSNSEVSRGIEFDYSADLSTTLCFGNYVCGVALEEYRYCIVAQRSGLKFYNNYGTKIGDNIRDGYPSNADTYFGVPDGTPYYRGQMMLLDGNIYIAKGTKTKEDWVKVN